jgi:hypothetical protein
MPTNAHHAYVARCNAIEAHLPPLAPVWSLFVDQVLLSHDAHDLRTTRELSALLRGNVAIHYDDFVFKRHHMAFAKVLDDIDVDYPVEAPSRWSDPRYAGVVFAMHALLLWCENWASEVLERVTAASMRSVHAHDARICSMIAADCWYLDRDWLELRQTACAWLRSLQAARAIQRAWRRHAVRVRAARLIQARWRFVVAWPRHVVCRRRLLVECVAGVIAV